MDLDTKCAVCHRFDEDGAHLFFKCKVMEKLWTYLGLSREREILLFKSSARDVMETVMNLKEEPKLRCCYALSMCWSERNRIREGEHERVAIWLSHNIQVRMAEWHKQLANTEKARLRVVRRWERPEQDYIKVNWEWWMGLRSA